MEKKNSDGKKKGVAVISANYVSILHLRERWMMERKEGKRMGKGLVDRGLKEQQHVEEAVMEPRVKLEGKSLIGGSWRPCGLNRSEKESLDGGEPKRVEKEKLEFSTDGEDGGGGDLRHNKKIDQGGSVEEIVKCESKASPSYIGKGKNPVKEEIGSVHKPNGENGVVKDSIGVETQFQDLCINKKVEDEGRDAKGPARLNEGQVSEQKPRVEHVLRSENGAYVTLKGWNFPKRH